MAVSVRMEPLLEKELELAAKRQGITKSQFIITALEKALGRKDPYKLLMQIKAEAANDLDQSGDSQEGAYQGDLGDAEAMRTFMREKLRKKHGIGPA